MSEPFKLLTNSKYMDFKLVGQTTKTTIWEVVSKKHGVVLGKILWYYNWRQYVFESKDAFIIFNASCLKDLVNVLQELNALQRRSK